LCLGIAAICVVLATGIIATSPERWNPLSRFQDKVGSQSICVVQFTNPFDGDRDSGDPQIVRKLALSNVSMIEIESELKSHGWLVDQAIAGNVDFKKGSAWVSAYPSKTSILLLEGRDLTPVERKYFDWTSRWHRPVQRLPGDLWPPQI
jgi:hypothetical protein